MTTPESELEASKLRAWARAALAGGGFVSAIAKAALKADDENFELMRPLMLELQRKYSLFWRPLLEQYKPSNGAMTQEQRAEESRDESDYHEGRGFGDQMSDNEYENRWMDKQR